MEEILNSTLETSEITLPPVDDGPAIVSPLRRSSRKQVPESLYDLTLDELEARLAARGIPAYRARQIVRWAYQKLAPSYASMTVLPKALRESLAAELPCDQLEPVRVVQTDDGETEKLLFRTADGQFIETVLMFYPDRVTVCVSCQVDCAVGC